MVYVLLRVIIHKNNGCKQHISEKEKEVVYAMDIKNYLISD